MRIILDECVNARLARELTGHDVRTVGQMGWAGVKNGALLKSVSGQCDVFLTVDRGFEHQQNVRQLPFAIVLLKTPSNKMSDLRPRLAALLDALQHAKPGSVTTTGEGAA